MGLTKLQKEIGEGVLENLQRLKTDYKNEIPAEFVHSNSPDSKYKIRKGWFASVSTSMFSLEQIGLISPTVIQHVADFRTQVRDVLGHHDVHPGKKHIDQTDALIDKVVDSLQKILSGEEKIKRKTKK